MVDELEPGPDPHKIRDPSSRKPPEPKRVPDVLRSYREDKAFSIRRGTTAEAEAVSAEIKAAVRWLNRWGRDAGGQHTDYDIRVRPYVTEHDDDGHYWKVNFWVHDPLPRGFRQMDADEMQRSHSRSAAVRGVSDYTQSQRGRRRRSVEQRAD